MGHGDVVGQGNGASHRDVVGQGNGVSHRDVVGQGNGVDHGDVSLMEMSCLWRYVGSRRC